MKNIIIQSERFDLRTLKKSDVGDRYVKWINSEDNPYIEYTNKKRSLADVQSYVVQREKNNASLFFGIFVRDNGEHIGNIKYEPIDFERFQTTMGILIGEKHWRGKGVATEVINISAEWLYENFNIKNIFLSVDVNNVGAIRAYEKSGFKENEALHRTKNQIIMQLNLNE
jgi:RimJ/RimL family protein N-acetyltransferase